MNLDDFLTTKMKMTSYYQPIIILTCLTKNGKATLEQIADASIYFGLAKSREEVIPKLKIHPKAVLASHGIVKLEKNEYTLTASYSNSSEVERMNCLEKIKQFKNR